MQYVRPRGRPAPDRHGLFVRGAGTRHYERARPGDGVTGRGADVTYTNEARHALADHEVDLAGEYTLDGFPAALDDAVLWPDPPTRSGFATTGGGGSRARRLIWRSGRPERIWERRWDASTTPSRSSSPPVSPRPTATTRRRRTDWTTRSRCTTTSRSNSTRRPRRGPPFRSRVAQHEAVAVWHRRVRPGDHRVL